MRTGTFGTARLPAGCDVKAAQPTCCSIQSILHLVGRGGQGPRAPHPPDRERVAQPLVRHVAAAGPSRVQLVALQNLAQEVDVPGRELQRLDFAQLVRREGGNDLT